MSTDLSGYRSSMITIDTFYAHRFKRHLGPLGKNFLVNNCGMYDSF